MLVFVQPTPPQKYNAPYKRFNVGVALRLLLVKLVAWEGEDYKGLAGIHDR